MEAYLNIAAAVLRSAKRPLSGKAILATAHRCGLVPPHLYGKTQHKTLQARLSEDIVEKKERSLFFRTAPGRFFLREFLSDKSIPEEFRKQAPTRRRFRELARGPALAIRTASVNEIMNGSDFISAEKMIREYRDNSFCYVEASDKKRSETIIRPFVCVIQKDMLLTYRLGRYREDIDTFLNKRCVGFSSIVKPSDNTLFTSEDFGIVNSGVIATIVDLDIPSDQLDVESAGANASLAYFALSHHRGGAGDLLAVINFQCPPWFEPIKKRLALNDLDWLDLGKPINNLEDFDPWSRLVLELHFS